MMIVKALLLIAAAVAPVAESGWTEPVGPPQIGSNNFNPSHRKLEDAGGDEFRNSSSANHTKSSSPSVTAFPSVSPTRTANPSLTVFPTVFPSASDAPSRTVFPTVLPSRSVIPTLAPTIFPTATPSLTAIPSTLLTRLANPSSAPSDSNPPNIASPTEPSLVPNPSPFSNTTNSTLAPVLSTLAPSNPPSLDGTDDYTGDGLPLSDAARAIVIVVHYATFVVVGFSIYAFVRKFDTIRQRIWSPFVLLIALTWLAIGPAFEIANHFYENNWQLYENNSDLINGSFSFFNFGAQNLLALSLRKKGLPFFAIGRGFFDCISLVFDFVFIGFTVVHPFIYGFMGREDSVTFLSPVAALAGIFTLFRLWRNLGPNVATLLGGILFFVLAICGVIALGIYRSTENEWIHILIAGSFVLSIIPLSIALWNAREHPDNVDVEIQFGEDIGEQPATGWVFKA